MTILALGFGAGPVDAAGPRLRFGDGSLSIEPGQTKSLTIRIESATELFGSDAVIHYDPNAIEVTGVVFVDADNNQSVFARNYWSNLKESESLSVLRISSTMDLPTSGFRGERDYAYVYVRARRAGPTQLSFVCNPGATNDSNLVEKSTANDVISCADTPSLPVNVSVGGSATPVPTPTPTTCSLPAAPSSLTATTIDADTILLSFSRADRATNYSVMYGTDASVYQYGANNFGDTDRLLVNFLKPNTRYYFALLATNNCGPSSTITAQATTAGFVRPTTNTTYTGTGTRTPSPTPMTSFSSPTPRASAIPGSTPSAASLCTNSGGTWKQFPDACADTCSTVALSQRTCAQVLTMSCDCGTSACFNGVSCVPNPTPQASATPLPPLPGNLTDDDLATIPSIDTPIVDGPLPTATDEPIPSPAPAQTPSSGPSLGGLILPIIGIVISLAGGLIFLIMRSRRQPIS